MRQHEDPRVAELESRIRQMEELDDSSLGRFGAWDWLVTVLAGLLLPAAALWWFAG